MIRRLVLVTATLAALGAIATALYLRMPLAAPLTDGSNAITYARAALSKQALPTLIDDARPQTLPLIVSLYEHGEARARGVGRGATFGAALRDALAQLASVDASHARIKLDRIIGRGRLSSTIAPLLAFGTVPGRDGIGATRGATEALRTVDDLLRDGTWGRYAPIPQFEFAAGVDPPRLLRALSSQLGGRPETIFRFRAEEWIERAPTREETTQGSGLPVIAGRTPGPALTKASVNDAIRAGGEYLMRHLSPEGRFDYEYFTIEDTNIGGEGYSLPRHAGSTSFLAQLYGVQRDPRVREAAERAIDYLARQRPHGCDGDRVCVGEGGEREVDLGSTALSLVAALEYARVTDDHRYDAFEDGLARFLLSMQKPDGEFCHLFDAEKQSRDEKTQFPYYSGEAAYGLGLLLRHRHGAVDPAIATALDASLRYLTQTQYAHLAGQFYVGEDHWTCMAVDAGWDYLPRDHRDRYADFCDAFSRFLRKTQFLPGEPLTDAEPWLSGAYGIAGVMAPHATPVGSRSESLISIWRVAKRRGLSDTDPRVHDPRQQIEEGMRFLLHHQIRDDAAYLVTNPDAARGGFLMSDTERYIRIDFLQHTCSSLLRSLEML